MVKTTTVIFILCSGAVASSMTAATDSTVSLACSDVTENTYVLLLEWKCEGACSKKENINIRISQNDKMIKHDFGRNSLKFMRIYPFLGLYFNKAINIHTHKYTYIIYIYITNF